MSIFFQFLPFGLHTSIATASEDADMPRDGFIKEQHAIRCRGRRVNLFSVVLATQPIAAALITWGHNLHLTVCRRMNCSDFVRIAPPLTMSVESHEQVLCRMSRDGSPPAGCWCSLCFTFQAVSPSRPKRYKLWLSLCCCSGDYCISVCSRTQSYVCYCFTMCTQAPALDWQSLLMCSVFLLLGFYCQS